MESKEETSTSQDPRIIISNTQIPLEKFINSIIK